jgi:hypothetical protein
MIEQAISSTALNRTAISSPWPHFPIRPCIIVIR